MKYFLFSVLVLTCIFSCKKDNDNDSLSKETICAKWAVDGTSDYESFEFNGSGNYIIVKSATSNSNIATTGNLKSADVSSPRIVLFGTYEILGSTIVLSDFGTIKLAEINDNSISFSIQLTADPSSEIIIYASKQAEIERTSKTELLCRTWKLISINGEVSTETEDVPIVLFSLAGTYWVQWSDDDEKGVAQWKWEDESETKFRYSWEDEPNWEEEAFVEIKELTNSSLVISEDIDDETFEYVFTPMDNTISATFKSCPMVNGSSIRKGFFNK